MPCPIRKIATYQSRPLLRLGLFCHLFVSKYCLVLMYAKYFEPHQCYNRENLESLQMIDGVLKVVDIFEFRQTVWWYVYPLLTERIMCKHETDDDDFDDDAPQARQHEQICAQRRLSSRTICGTKERQCWCRVLGKEMTSIMHYVQ